MRAKDEQHFEGKIHQNAIVTTRGGDRVLLARDPRDELWELPGGRLNLGETPEEGLRREIREELGIEVEIGGIYHTQYIWHMRDQRQNFLIMYEVFVPSEEVAFELEAEEVAEVQWVTKDTYKDVPLFDDVRESLDAYFQKRG